MQHDGLEAGDLRKETEREKRGGERHKTCLLLMIGFIVEQTTAFIPDGILPVMSKHWIKACIHHKDIR